MLWPRLWGQLLTNFIIPEAPKSPPKERKVVIVGLTRLLTQCSLMAQQPLAQEWSVAPLPSSPPSSLLSFLLKLPSSLPIHC